MKKFTLGVVITTLIITILYLILAPKYIDETIKEEIKTEIIKLEDNGFSVSDRERKDDKEYFILGVNNPIKISNFLKQYGLNSKVEEINEIKDLKIGVHLVYLKSSITLDIYPISIPEIVEKKYITIIKDMKEIVKRKALVLHLEIDHKATIFNGYIKDINETIMDKNSLVEVILNGFSFEGSIKDNLITTLTQKIKQLNIYSKDRSRIDLTNLESSYHLNNQNGDRYNSSYIIDKIELLQKDMDNIKVIVNNLNIDINSTIENNITIQRVISKIKKISYNGDINLNNLDLNMSVDKFDSKLNIELETFGTENIDWKNRKVNGFELHGSLDLKRSFNIVKFIIKPNMAVEEINADLNLALSKKLLNLIIKEPRAMIAYMMYRPKTLNGKKVYRIKIKDNYIKINGKKI